MQPIRRLAAVFAVVTALVIISTSAAMLWRTALPFVSNGPPNATQLAANDAATEATKAAQRDKDDAATVTAQQTAYAAAQATQAALQLAQEAAIQATQQAQAEAATATVQALTASGCIRYVPMFGPVENLDPSDPEYFVSFDRVTGDHNYTGGYLIAPTWYNVSIYHEGFWRTLPADATLIDTSKDHFLIAARYQFSLFVCPKV